MKKYKRSEWYEGLLWVENAMYYNYSNEFFLEHADGMQSYVIYTRVRSQDKPWVAKHEVSIEFGQGVLDYIEYRQKKLLAY